ncbi:MAG: bifunctional metallophosphatase/5'-nucleotidase, partial [Actinomycetota bacterium]
MHHRPRRLSARLLAALALVAALLASTLAASASAEGGSWYDDDWRKPSKTFTLTILHNNDGESELVGSDTEAGVARFQTVVNQQRFKALRGSGRYWWRDRSRGVILVSSGDNFLAGPAFTASLNDGVFYDALALDQLRYDAIDLGNHDFDFGPEVLADFITEFRRPGKPPYLSSNLDFSAEPDLQALVDRGVIAKSTVVRERGRRIGIIGATTENLPFISSPRDVVVNAVQPAVQAEADALTKRGVDIIILISHLQDIEGDIALAQQLRGIDVMIAGGGDELLANPDDPLLPSDQALQDDPDEDDPVFGAYPQIATDADGRQVPVVTTSGQYGYLGRLAVEFDRKGNVLSWGGGPIRVLDPSQLTPVLTDAVLANAGI